MACRKTATGAYKNQKSNILQVKNEFLQRYLMIYTGEKIWLDVRK